MIHRRSTALAWLAIVWAVAWPMAASAQNADSTDAGHTHPPPAPRDGNTDLPDFIPALTDEDRKAAFPLLRQAHTHESSLNGLMLFDRIEWRTGQGAAGMTLDSRGWVGGDRDRLWFRMEADADDGRLSDAKVHALFGRRLLRWWDVLGGIRQDLEPGVAQTWATVGIQGLAPYWFDVEAFAYLGGSGRTEVRVEAKYELLMTNRIVLQPLVAVELSGKSDPARGVGAGLTATNLGLRLRYEFRREIAPYIGVNWHREYGTTAELAADRGEASAVTEAVAGVRIWF